MVDKLINKKSWILATAVLFNTQVKANIPAWWWISDDEGEFVDKNRKEELSRELYVGRSISGRWDGIA